MSAHRTARWTQAEIAVLEEFYPSEGVDCVEYLPGRTWMAVLQKANKLGLRCEKITPAPEGKLEGDALEEAIRLREQENWSFARIGAKFGISEASACNCVLIALCPRKGFRPAERDENGRLLPEGIKRLRYALKLGLKACDIQLRLGLSAGRVSLERRRYNAELKAAGKMLLPPPGKGETYSGVKLTAAKKREVEALFMEGLGTAKISERTGVSKTSCTRIRNRLRQRLSRKGETLPGCDVEGVRHEQAESARFVTDEQRALLFAALRNRTPVRRAALDLAIGLSTAYRLRDEFAAELAERGEELPAPRLPGSSRRNAPRALTWPPAGPKQIYAFRALLTELSFSEAKERWRDMRRVEVAEEHGWSPAFMRQMERVAEGRIGLTPAFSPAHLEPLARSLAL